MSTDISVVKTTYDVEDRSWLASPHGTEPGTTPGVTLHIAGFTQADHYPNGFIPSGTILAKLSTGTYAGQYVPYLEDSGATDGSDTAAGVLFNTVSVYNSDHSTKTAVGAAILVHGFVKKSNLPFTSSTTTGGYIDAGGQSDLPLIYWEA